MALSLVSAYTLVLGMSTNELRDDTELVCAPADVIHRLAEIESADSSAADGVFRKVIVVILWFC
jgi:hypothetical protein